MSQAGIVLPRSQPPTKPSLISVEPCPPTSNTSVISDTKFPSLISTSREGSSAHLKAREGPPKHNLIVYSDNEVTIEERMAAMPKYAFIPSQLSASVPETKSTETSEAKLVRRRYTLPRTKFTPKPRTNSAPLPTTVSVTTVPATPVPATTLRVETVENRPKSRLGFAPLHVTISGDIEKSCPDETTNEVSFSSVPSKVSTASRGNTLPVLPMATDRIAASHNRALVRAHIRREARGISKAKKVPKSEQESTVEKEVKKNAEAELRELDQQIRRMEQKQEELVKKTKNLNMKLEEASSSRSQSQSAPESDILEWPARPVRPKPNPSVARGMWTTRIPRRISSYKCLQREAPPPVIKPAYTPPTKLQNPYIHISKSMGRIVSINPIYNHSNSNSAWVNEVVKKLTKIATDDADKDNVTETPIEQVKEKIGAFRSAAVWEFIGHTFEKAERDKCVKHSGSRRRHRTYAPGFNIPGKSCLSRQILSAEEDEEKEEQESQLREEWGMLFDGHSGKKVMPAMGLGIVWE